MAKSKNREISRLNVVLAKEEIILPQKIEKMIRTG